MNARIVIFCVLLSFHLSFGEESAHHDETLFYEFMTPETVNKYATYIDKDHLLTASQLTFNGGATDGARLLRIPIIPEDKLSRREPLTVKIVVGLDASIGGSTVTDSDISYGITDGVDFHGFEYPDLNHYASHLPCFGKQGKSGSTLSSATHGPDSPPLKGQKYPGQAVITFKPTEQWGSCYTAHDGGFLNYMKYKTHLDLTKGIFLEAYKDGKGDRLGIKFIEVTVMHSI